jgi:hypothetical protein
LRIVLGLLSVNQGYSIDIVILVIGVLIPAHYQFFLGSLQANRSHWLGTFTRNIHIGHILIGHTSWLRGNVVLVSLLTSTQGNGVAQLAGRSNSW